MFTDDTVHSLAYEEWLGEPHSGDFSLGEGTSTSQLQNPNISLAANRAGSGISGPALLQSPLMVAIIIALLVGVKLTTEKAGERSEFSTVRIGLENLFIVGTMAALWIFGNRIAAVWFSKNFPNNFTRSWAQFWGNT